MSTAAIAKPKTSRRKAKVISCYLCLDEKVCHVCRGAGALHRWNQERQAYDRHSGLSICWRCKGSKVCPKCGKKG